MAREFTREELHALVWSKPMTQLAKEFALSDVALHKLCRKHQIPKPPQGWWARKAAGRAVKPTPLPRAKAGQAASISIRTGQGEPMSDAIATARAEAKARMSTLASNETPSPNPVVERTTARLRKAKPDGPAGLVSVEGQGLIKCQLAPASIDRFELAIQRIAAAAATIGIELVPGEKAATFVCEGETIGFSVTEAVRREKHIPTEKEKADQDAWQRKQALRWRRNSWDDLGSSFLGPQIPEWDIRPTGLLTFELEQPYLLGDSPRRSFRDARTQQLETMAAEIVVGIMALAAAKKQDRLRREEIARLREQERLRREQELRDKHVAERRAAALETILGEMAALERLRGLVAALRTAGPAAAHGRVASFVAFAEGQLERREAALSPDGLGRRFDEQRLFGSDDGQDFRPY